ncbi:RimJ/RimL family protein N-acetyltransferase [Thermosporothrix hazakensis]|jgi:RimJ/RimL family protein N-acetyltransferase|uniref:RimJ/RimL family protein N-acetyltransferase n=2 Tax=Thermosporothrix TaxID=768650 RepID=A0A326U3R4_THEHA|nr:GNAT family N-acetyltransferase [Thermosporothrix hazakensis]PZW26305.1 RimJ/RimL family protein N-acetyltransferase [Thermosporothrix hazakensis]BBH90692.1 ribosomal-protein-serine acetyltransferase [Thermosporothrix sp. COM3]GCE48743.1 ribosomal-protein-serine acetyltransferase [Thermosporothrix hazakensis]
MMASVIRPVHLKLFDELRGERVTLRPFRESDIAPYFEALSESRAQLRPWLAFADAYQTLEEVRPWIMRGMANWLLREDMPLHMWDTCTGRFLGGFGIHPHDWDAGSFELGYWLRTSATGRGYVTEAVRLATDFLFTELQANRVFIRCDERNVRSAAIPRRLGFQFEGCLRNAQRATNGSLASIQVYSLIPEDYQRLRAEKRW